MADIFRTLIIKSENVELARQISEAFGGGTMWTTPLSSSGLEPATHYISSGYIPSDFAFMVPYQSWKQNEQGMWQIVSTEPGDPIAVYEACVKNAKIECTQNDINSIYATTDASDQEPFTALNRLGLKLIENQL